MIETQLFANFGFIDGIRFEHLSNEINPHMQFPSIYLLQNQLYYECIDCNETQTMDLRIKEFIKKYQNGTLYQIYKSQNAPNVKSTLFFYSKQPKELSFNSFETVVYDENVNLLILFYTPLCHHCTHYHHFFDMVNMRILLFFLFFCSF